jgi:hypothetical protein
LLKIQKSTCLLTKDEINSLIYDYDLYLSKSFYIINKERKEYNEDNHSPDFMSHIQKLEKASGEGCTIIVKNMERYNSQIQETAEELAPGTDVHLYLVFAEESGDSFNWHRDDKPVWIKMIYGEKFFSIRSRAKETVFIDSYKVKENGYLYIGLREHRAEPMGPSAMLSFGLPNQEDL